MTTLVRPGPDVGSALAGGRDYATERGRLDLSEHLNRAETLLREQAFPVLVVGEFKRGKSTLINALLQRDICPVDADLATTLPMSVSWSRTPRTVAHPRGADESGHEPAAGSVEVTLPHRLLRSGLALIDTPGTGGLDSAHGVLALSMLRSARGTLFVTDAGQELTRPELDFLTSAAQRCPTIALVVTKIDLHREWRRIVELNRAHLSRAGLDLPVLPVSSLLRLAADGDDDELNAESGFEPLITFLASEVVGRGRHEAVAAVADELGYVTDQLEQQADIEQAVLEHPESASVLVKDLTQARERAAGLTRPSASWQQMLNDGVQDLISDIEHDLGERLRRVVRDVDEVIEAGDPRHAWPDTEAWLRRQVALIIMGNRDQLVDRANELAATAAREFRLDAEQVFAVALSTDDDWVAGVGLDPVTGAPPPGGGKLVSYVMAARTGYLVAMVGGTLAVGLAFPLQALVVGLATLLGTGLGGKLLLGEVRRQRAQRQQQAKAAARRYVDDVAFELNKQTRDRLRYAHRQLRDEFQARAEHLHQSSLQSLEAARRAAELDPAGREQRRQALAGEQQQLEQVRSSAAELRRAA